MQQLQRVEACLPHLAGKPVFIEVLPDLSVLGKQLHSGAGRGRFVYAASFIRQRRVVLDAALLAEPDSLRAILLHEIFHFVWVRLGNPLRASFTQLLAEERECHARGELGESSGVAKTQSFAAPKYWKEYVCESFCDTGAFLLGGIPAGQDCSLSKSRIKSRRTWFVKHGSGDLRF